jgi:membrane protease YdiL (CAAX protease family)
LDAHLHHPGEYRPVFSAVFVSALWGLWHLPLLSFTSVGGFIVLALRVVLGHVVVGVFLSFGWRRSGNLGVPAIVHAFIDAVRNTFLVG